MEDVWWEQGCGIAGALVLTTLTTQRLLLLSLSIGTPMLSTGPNKKQRTTKKEWSIQLSKKAPDPRLFNYKSSNENAEKYGKFYWGVILSDGRFLSFYANKVDVKDGALIATREVLGPNEDDGLPQNALIIAAGQWSSCYAASVITGDPICVDRTEGTE